MSMKKFERKAYPPIKDKRPKDMKSVPVIGYALQQAYEHQLITVDDLIAEAVRGLREEESENEQ